MTLDQILVLAVFASTILSLIFTTKSPALIFAVSVLSLLLLGILDSVHVLSNLSNKGLVILVLLLLVSLAVDKSGLIKSLGRKLISEHYGKSLFKVLSLSFFSSALLNNTAVVSTLSGPIKHNNHIAPSKLLIPLSYAAILGGTVTLIGTSTNLIVDSFLIEHGHPGFAFWDFTLYGLTAGIISCFVVFLCTWLLPEKANKQQLYKSYIIEAKVESGSPLVGKSVADNHLRNLPELFLVEIVRNKRLISPVTPEIVIEQHDKLIFSGNIERVDSLDHIKGLSFFADANGLLRENLTEVVVSNRSQLIGKTMKQVGFRSLFDAAVMAVRRDGEALSGKLGEIKLRAGDFLLLATGNDFKNRNNINSNFFVLNERRVNTKLKKWQDILAIGGFLIAIGLASFDLVGLDISLLCLLVTFIFSKNLSTNEVKRGLPLNLIVVIVGALSLSTALEQTGLIARFTQLIEPVLMSTTPFTALVLVYLTTLLLTELVTNNAAAALMFPFAYGVAQSLGLPIMPFALSVAFAASASFMSPYGYQTNLLVHSAGGYHTKDFIKIGLPISITFSVIVLAMLKWQYGL
ncbi:MAG: SLC13 family permease [Aestuariibacter sp.]